ncbi:MAG TPA: GNAT family protein [Longimicrobium sp.]|nr:GNAT family protein [Longimicrobium sp.]
MQTPFLQGERVYLRPLMESDAAGAYPDWFNDEEVCAGNSHHVFPYTQEAALGYIRHAREARDRLILAVVQRDGDRHIGTISLQKIHPVYRAAEFAIMIGERSAWGQGYSREASRLICDHGFAAMNLHRIACGTFADNTAMRKLAAYLGMKEEGVRRHAAFKRGRWVDVVEYGVLADEYRQHWAAGEEGAAAPSGGTAAPDA